MISVAAELADMHPQTLRMYEARGLITPKRSPRNTRLYSQRDVERLRRIQQMTSEEGLNLAGVETVLEMEERVESMRAELEKMRRRTRELEREMAEEMARVRQLAAQAEIVPYGAYDVIDTPFGRRAASASRSSARAARVRRAAAPASLRSVFGRRRTSSFDRTVVLGMAAGRVGIGTAALLATRPALKGLGLDQTNSSARVLGRMAGARDIALAALQLQNIDDAEKLRDATLAAVAADAADAAIFLAAGRHAEMRRASAMSAPLAIAAVIGGLWLADRL